MEQLVTVAIVEDTPARCAARNANMLLPGTRCSAIISASRSCRSARSKPCMTQSSQVIEHGADKHTVACDSFQQAPSASSPAAPV